MNQLGFELPNVTLDEVKNCYVLDGKPYVRVSHILEMMSKPWLGKWMVNEMAKDLLQDIKPTQSFSSWQLDAIITKARDASKRKAESAMKTGTAAHKWFQNHIMNPTKTIEIPKDVKPAIEEFLAWEKQHDVYWHASEMTVVSRLWGVAGTFDFIARIDGKWTLGDFKTSAMISPEHFLQTGSYQLMLEELDVESKCPIDQRMIVHIPKGEQRFHPIIVKTNIVEDKKAFMSLVLVYNWYHHHAGVA